MTNIDKKWLIIVTLIVIIIGTIMHFVYQWSGKNTIVGLVAPVNESVWEHLKLIVFPLILAVIVEAICLSRKKQYLRNPLSAVFAAIGVGMIFIIVTFYTYTGAITKTSNVFVDIGTFVVAAFLSSLILHYIFRLARFDRRVEIAALIALLLLITLIFCYTYSPPNLPLFTDPLAK